MAGIGMGRVAQEGAAEKSIICGGPGPGRAPTADHPTQQLARPPYSVESPPPRDGRPHARSVALRSPPRVQRAQHPSHQCQERCLVGHLGQEWQGFGRAEHPSDRAIRPTKQHRGEGQHRRVGRAGQVSVGGHCPPVPGDGRRPGQRLGAVGVEPSVVVARCYVVALVDSNPDAVVAVFQRRYRPQREAQPPLQPGQQRVSRSVKVNERHMVAEWRRRFVHVHLAS